MCEPIKTVLISCGSFNPITHMHLRMFELAKDYLSREANHTVLKGIISPTHDTYETSKHLAPGVDRCRMARLSLTPLLGEPHWVEVDEWECRQSRWHRTLQVLDHHFTQLNDPSISLKLLCGADLFDTFNVPNLWAEDDIKTICGKYGLVVVTREGFDPWKTLEDSPKSRLLSDYKSNIFIVNEYIFNSISSTAVRNAIKGGRSVRYLVPDSVLQYIKTNQLYQ